MRPKLLIMLVLVLVLTLHGITAGQIWEIVLPNSPDLMGRALCLSGGFIVNPIIDLGWVKVPLPTVDDIYVGIVLMIIGLYVMRLLGVKKWWKIAIAIPLFLFTGIYLYKLFGVLLVYFAETAYGMENCIETVDLGVIKLDWRWYDPIFFVMIFSASITAIAAIWRFKAKASSDSGGSQ